MGFFEEQDRARRATNRLLVMYAIAVAILVAAANVLIVPICMLWFGANALWQSIAAVSATTLAIIAMGSFEIMARLSLGEAELLTLLAGRRVPRGSGVDAERRLVNVVDEMAIASGLAAPPVYVLTRERGINAFAAGRSPNQAVVAVTRGALDNLSRDELQAVIAHEFSHIINGDIRLNIRAACVLQGIVFLSAIGRFMMQYYSGYGTEEGRRFFHLPLAAIGGAIWLIGLGGVPLARVIQAAISREREYLADACAVQYTRNADGLCGALARIQTSGVGHRLLNWHAEAMAHMLFAASSHPPIERRMVRVNPHLPPSFYLERARKPAVFVEKKAAAAKAGEPEKPTTIAPTRTTAVAMLVAAMGEPSAASLEHAAGLLAYLPGPVREALGDPEGAQAVMLGCLLEAEGTGRTGQLRALEALGLEKLGRKAAVLSGIIAGLDRAYRLALVALSLPVLKELDEGERRAFLAAVKKVIEADSRVTLSEFVFATILESNLGEQAKLAGQVRYARRQELAPDCALVLSLLAHAGGPGAAEAFLKGKQTLGLPELALAQPADLKLNEVTQALGRLRGLAPLEKQPLISACVAIAMADGNVKLLEHELMRAVCSALDCPMPPALAALDQRLLRKT